MKTILVTGGAGYIGTNVVNVLAKKKYNVVVIDNFSNSKKTYINKLVELYPKQIKLIEEDILNLDKLNKIFQSFKIDAVIHFAGKKYVAESFEKEEEYYLNNITATNVLLEAMSKNEVNKIVFSSSITVYGNCEKSSIKETQAYNPLSPYASHKMIGEQMIKKWATKKGNSAVILRLSNPIGADSNLMLGEDSISGRQGLLPYLIESCCNNKPLVFNGNDHPTRDGTTIRDYIHVLDVAQAFTKAVGYKSNKSYNVFNIGTGGKGFTVLEVLSQVQKTLNKKMDFSFGPRRAGDASIIVSNIEKAEKILKHKSKQSLKNMVESQYKFQVNKKEKTLY